MGSPDVVGLVTARSGSKSIPHKNVAPVAGKPLMAWTIEAALAARMLRRVIVSTDDPRYAETARAWGAEVPFLRPAVLSGDDSPHVDTVLHALDWLAAEGDEPEYILVLQPTSPLRLADDIDAAVRVAASCGASAVVSVAEAATHPYLTMQITADGRLVDFVPKPAGYLRRQGFPAAYALNGAIYLVRSAVLRAEQSLCPPGARPYVMPAERSLDVDTAWDLHVAELVLRDRRREAAS